MKEDLEIILDSIDKDVDLSDEDKTRVMGTILKLFESSDIEQANPYRASSRFVVANSCLCGSCGLCEDNEK